MNAFGVSKIYFELSIFVSILIFSINDCSFKPSVSIPFMGTISALGMLFRLTCIQGKSYNL